VPVAGLRHQQQDTWISDCDGLKREEQLVDQEHKAEEASGLALIKRLVALSFN
jgi:hypothetical protein